MGQVLSGARSAVLKKYWYYIEVIECVLCGRDKIYKTRQYTTRPENYDERHKFTQDACSHHFC